ncbi:hypothetical protein RDABS01_010140 [Bienertia sinuspersici]
MKASARAMLDEAEARISA